MPADCPKRASLACQTGTDEPTDAPLDGGPLLWLQVISGTVNLNGSDAVPERLQQGDGLGFQRMDAVIDDLSAADAEADILLFALP